MQKYHLLNRPNREIASDDEVRGIFRNGKFAVISMCRNNEPYIVTLSYGYDEANNALYFHCSTKGLKLDFIKANPKVCATIIEDGGYVANECGHNYKTAVFTGNISVVANFEEKKHGMVVLLNHLENNPDVISEKFRKTEGMYDKMEILKLEIVDVHAKAGR